MNQGEKYWSDRYKAEQTGWDIGHASPPLTALTDWLDSDTKILIPGAGNAHEVEVFYNKGFKNVFVLDIAKEPLENLANRFPSFPSEQLIHGDFFELDQTFDVILEQTFFCALPRQWRNKYVKQAHKLLRPGGKILGVMFAQEFSKDGPPHGGTAEEYRGLFSANFDIERMESCFNSIPPRQGAELFVRMVRKEDTEG
jgi:SAM-dependent methyltransferase